MMFNEPKFVCVSIGLLLVLLLLMTLPIVSLRGSPPSGSRDGNSPGSTAAVSPGERPR